MSVQIRRVDATANKPFADTAAVPGPPPPRTSATVRVCRDERRSVELVTGDAGACVEEAGVADRDCFAIPEGQAFPERRIHSDHTGHAVTVQAASEVEQARTLCMNRCTAVRQIANLLQQNGIGRKVYRVFFREATGKDQSGSSRRKLVPQRVEHLHVRADAVNR